MSVVDLSEQEWASLMNVLATTKEHPWTVTNPLLMKIGSQLQAQAQARPAETAQAQRIEVPSNGKEARHE